MFSFKDAFFFCKPINRKVELNFNARPSNQWFLEYFLKYFIAENPNSWTPFTECLVSKMKERATFHYFNKRKISQYCKLSFKYAKKGVKFVI